MELIFKTNSGVELYEDLDHTFISTNPAEVLACIMEDKRSGDIFSKICATDLLKAIEDAGGIWYNPEGPKKILSCKKSIFIAKDEKGNSLFGFSSTVAMDFQVHKNLSKPCRLIVI